MLQQDGEGPADRAGATAMGVAADSLAEAAMNQDGTEDAAIQEAMATSISINMC